MVGRDHALEHWGILVWVNAIGMVLATATLTNLIVGCQKPSRPAPPPPAVTVANPLEKEITDWNEYTGGPTAAESVKVRPWQA